MKFSIRSLALLPCLAAFLLAAAPTAHAGSFSVSGSVWETAAFSNVPVSGSSIYSTTPTATFTLTNPSASGLFSFNSNGSADYTLNSFLTSGLDGITYNSGASHSGDLLNSPAGCHASGSNVCTSDDLFQFAGSTTLVDGKYNFQHDDGLLLYLNNSLIVNQGGPTSAVNTTLCVGSGQTGCDFTLASAGTYSFELDYAEVAGAPAVLTTSLPLTSTPEPSSFILLGSGLLAAAGVVRRRFIA